jgi:hypothetical protein
MEPALITGLSAVLGSLSGGLASVVTTWMTQRNQTRRDRLRNEIEKRELLYGEFVNEVARLTADAAEHPLEHAEMVVKLFALLSRIRFVSSQSVLDAAEECSRHVLELYVQEKMAPEDLLDVISRTSPQILKAFSEACRSELQEVGMI